MWSAWAEGARLSDGGSWRKEWEERAASGGQLWGQCPWPPISMRPRSARHGNRSPHRSLGRSEHLSSHRWWRALARTHACTGTHTWAAWRLGARRGRQVR